METHFRRKKAKAVTLKNTKFCRVGQWKKRIRSYERKKEGIMVETLGHNRSQEYSTQIC
jgi:hypothetical protein